MDRYLPSQSYFTVDSFQAAYKCVYSLIYYVFFCAHINAARTYFRLHKPFYPPAAACLHYRDRIKRLVNIVQGLLSEHITHIVIINQSFNLKVRVLLCENFYTDASE